jgi:hypothetical protein
MSPADESGDNGRQSFSDGIALLGLRAKGDCLVFSVPSCILRHTWLLMVADCDLPLNLFTDGAELGSDEEAANSSPIRVFFRKSQTWHAVCD